MSYTNYNLYDMTNFGSYGFNNYGCGNMFADGSGIAGLFTNVPGLNTVFNYGGSGCCSNFSNNYYSFGAGGCCDNNNSGLGTIIGYGATMLLGTIGLAWAGNHRAEKKAAEQQAKTDTKNFNDALTTLGINKTIDELVANPSIIKETYVDSDIPDAKLTEINSPVTKLEAQKVADEAKYSDTALEKLKPDNCSSNDIDTIIDTWNDKIKELNKKPDSETSEARTTREAALKAAEKKRNALKNLKTLKESWEDGGKKYKELESAKEKATSKKAEYVEKMNKAAKTVREYVAKKKEEKDKIAAQEAADQAKAAEAKTKADNKLLDKADGKDKLLGEKSKEFDKKTKPDKNGIRFDGTAEVSDLEVICYRWRMGTLDHAHKCAYRDAAKEIYEDLVNSGTTEIPKSLEKAYKEIISVYPDEEPKTTV